ncbi:hypothetical protein ABZ635_04240 [Nocardiopsis sp. NPDC007018]|uniref:hypothetical protein n=1 Tax=Nocardiopsis sp. NPDC007018 TaxID=3155721 RepID=UPI0033FB6C06
MSAEEHEEHEARALRPSEDSAPTDESRGTDRKRWHQLSREEVMERLENYQAKQRANRRRLTGDDVQELLRERRALRGQRRRERRERRESGRSSQRDVARTVRLSLSGALLVGAVGTGALAASSTDSSEGQSQRNEHTIALLKGEIRAMESDTWDEQDASALVSQMEGAVEQAREKGEQVVEAQNTYQELLFDLNDTERPEPGGRQGDPEGVYAPMDDLRKELVDLFDESARIVENEDLYYPDAHTIYGPREIDVLAPWYVRLEEDGITYSEPSLNSWELVSAAPRQESPDSIDVGWLNRDAVSGEVLSWAKANYNVQTGMFHSVYVGVTTIGERPAGDTGPDAGTDGDEGADTDSDTDAQEI